MAPNPALVVVDTSVVSLIFRQDGRGPFYEAYLRLARPVISFQTLEELRFGAYDRHWGERRTREIESHIDRYEVVWPNLDPVATCAALRSERKPVGRLLNQADAWIAATALMLECPLASDDGDFVGIPEIQLIRAPSP